MLKFKIKFKILGNLMKTVVKKTNLNNKKLLPGIKLHRSSMN